MRTKKTPRSETTFWLKARGTKNDHFFSRCEPRRRLARRPLFGSKPEVPKTTTFLPDANQKDASLGDHFLAQSQRYQKRPLFFQMRTKKTPRSETTFWLKARGTKNDHFFARCEPKRRLARRPLFGSKPEVPKTTTFLPDANQKD